MNQKHVLAAGLGLGAMLVLSVAASAATLNVTPGLWEMTSTGEATGAPPIPADVLARLPPDQRAMMEQRIKASMAKASQPRVNRQCVTPQDLQRGFDINDKENSAPDSGCQRAVSVNTGSVMEVRQTCTGQRAMTMFIHFEAASPQAITGRVEVTMADGANKMTVKRQISGKWIGADCGALAKKP